MDHVRGAMRGENRLYLNRAVADPQLQKSAQNLTKAVDRYAEDLILDALRQKFPKLPGVKAYTVSSDELAIKTFPEGASESTANLVVFIDPIDGTEFIESLQGGWSLIAVYDRRANGVPTPSSKWRRATPMWRLNSPRASPPTTFCSDCTCL
jgi:fructose-1,6-bisphosphatase/inositol monophosphatase family enzyme